jgi:hypothetical protein
VSLTTQRRVCGALAGSLFSNDMGVPSRSAGLRVLQIARHRLMAGGGFSQRRPGVAQKQIRPRQLDRSGDAAASPVVNALYSAVTPEAEQFRNLGGPAQLFNQQTVSGDMVFWCFHPADYTPCLMFWSTPRLTQDV